MNGWRAAWAVLGLIGLVLELVTLRRQTPAANDTLSACTRTVFRTHTRSGRWAFRTGLYILFRWLDPHILKETR